jgi:hypothetical protein
MCANSGLPQLAKHSEMNRLKILGAFENMPNIIEMARNKAASFPLDSKNPRSIELHKSMDGLHATLLGTLPALINRLIPGTFRKQDLSKWRLRRLQRAYERSTKTEVGGVLLSPFAGFDIDRLLDTVSSCAETVRVCAASMMDDIILDNHHRSKGMELTLDEVLRQLRIVQMSIDAVAVNGKDHVYQFLRDQISKLQRLMRSSAAAAHYHPYRPQRLPKRIPRKRAGVRHFV